MSRSYLLEVDFDKSPGVARITKFFTKWCGKDQILRVYKDYIWCEMGCSSGVAPEDTMAELYNQLIDSGFKLSRGDIIAWSLHPDEAICLEDDDEVDAALIGRN